GSSTWSRTINASTRSRSSFRSRDRIGRQRATTPWGADVSATLRTSSTGVMPSRGTRSRIAATSGRRMRPFSTQSRSTRPATAAAVTACRPSTLEPYPAGAIGTVFELHTGAFQGGANCIGFLEPPLGAGHTSHLAEGRGRCGTGGSGPAPLHNRRDVGDLVGGGQSVVYAEHRHDLLHRSGERGGVPAGIGDAVAL